MKKKKANSEKRRFRRKEACRNTVYLKSFIGFHRILMLSFGLRVAPVHHFLCLLYMT